MLPHGTSPLDVNFRDVQNDVAADVRVRQVFGRQGKHNIGLIIAQSFEDDGSRARPYETVLPLSKDLGLPIHHSWFVIYLLVTPLLS